ncbi:MAG TPA: sugar nucleotide-binding protein, partial [Chitinophagales bacterium]|nr:sugar nucleotide-binding protein [Chitinophagales bacterium]
MNILITGSNGQLGNELRVIAQRTPQHTYTFVDVDRLDITDSLAVNRFFAEGNYAVCINCAAYTAVDK